MLREKDATGVAAGLLKGARPTGISVGHSATGGDPGAAAIVARWSTNRKREVVLRLLRGESVDAVSREDPYRYTSLNNGATGRWPA